MRIFGLRLLFLKNDGPTQWLSKQWGEEDCREFREFREVREVKEVKDFIGVLEFPKFPKFLKLTIFPFYSSLTLDVGR